MNEQSHGTEEPAFEARARELLQQSAQALDGRVRSRLTQARHAALAALPADARAAASWRRWIPAGAVASAALAMLLFVNQPGVNPAGVGAQGAFAQTSAAASGIDDLDLLADNDAVEMSDMPDYDFYEWAAAETDGTAEAEGT